MAIKLNNVALCDSNTIRTHMTHDSSQLKVLRMQISPITRLASSAHNSTYYISDFTNSNGNKQCLPAILCLAMKTN